jgi:hypothetical protein
MAFGVAPFLIGFWLQVYFFLFLTIKALNQYSI